MKLFSATIMENCKCEDILVVANNKVEIKERRLINMKLQLSCFCCGSTDFIRTEQPCTNIEGYSYLFHNDIRETEVTCSKCGLIDYVDNLVIKYD